MTPSTIAATTSRFPRLSLQFIEEWLSSSDNEFVRDVLPSYIGVPFIIFVVGVGAVAIFGFVLIVRDCCLKSPNIRQSNTKATITATIIFIVLGVLLINLANIGLTQLEKGFFQSRKNIEIVERLLRETSLLIRGVQNSTSVLNNVVAEDFVLFLERQLQ